MNVDWLSPSNLLHRFDARYYSPEYIAIEDALENSPYKWAYLGTFVERIFKGAFYILADEYVSSGIPFIRVGDINAGYVDLSRCVHLTPELHRRESKTRVQPGYLLIAKSGELRHCAIVPDSIREANISQDLVGVTLKTEQIHPHYLQMYLSSGFGYEQMTRGIQGNAHPHISNDEFKLVRVANAPITVQRSIGQKVRAAERLRAAAAANVCDAVSQVSELLGTGDYSALKPNADGACDYFSGFVTLADLGMFHGAQFYAPKRKRAVSLINATGIGEKLGIHGRRVRSKGKRKAVRGHVDPANVSGGDGFWYSGGSDDGGDVVLAKPGHALFLRMRPYLNKTTINDTNQVVSGSPEFLVYEFDGLDAYYATMCLRQPWALAQVAEIATGDRPRVDGEFVDEVVVPWPDDSIRHEIGQLYQSSFALRRRADKLVQHAIADVENLIGGKLDEAACLAGGRNLAEEFGLEVP